MIRAVDIQSSKAIQSVRRLLHVINGRQSLPSLIPQSLSTLLDGISGHSDLQRLLFLDPFASLEGEVKQGNHLHHSGPGDKQKIHAELSSRKKNVNRNRETPIQPDSAHDFSTQGGFSANQVLSTSQTIHPNQALRQDEHGSVAPETLSLEQQASAGTTRVKDLLEHYTKYLEQQSLATSVGLPQAKTKAKGKKSEHIKQTINALRDLQNITVSLQTLSGSQPPAKFDLTKGNDLLSPAGSTQAPDILPQFATERQQVAVRQAGDKQNASDVLQTLVSTVWNQNDPDQSTPTTTTPSLAIDGPGPDQFQATSHHVSENSFAGELQQLIQDKQLVPMGPIEASESAADWPATPLNLSTSTTDEDKIVGTVNRALRDAARRNGVDLP